MSESSSSTVLGTPDDRAAALDAAVADIDQMSMQERLEFLQAMSSGPASSFGADDCWANLEGVISFFHDRGMGAPGTWVSYMNAAALESIERGIAIALDGSADAFGNPGAESWAIYLTRLRSDELATKGAHDEAWSRAKEVCTDYGVKLAEQVHGLQPTEEERRFLLFAQLYNWALRNRPAVDAIITYGGLLDPRLAGLQPGFVDEVLNVSDSVAVRKGCELAYAIAHVEPSSRALSPLDLIPQLLGLHRTTAA